ncbi:protein-(glutamine-N5) methyltransferase, release factor-specific [Enterococcus sp. JM4C]|uniref:peptide chain release factor N(5)-glutamine methyltransferase n=1 Tax=Candidatus Enterococcus huntleyi TaxID=1857217 RepID=UPI0013797BF4|nr:peptide chain release factor N(5)-glutamine methyltransferase [Enterococcus sp. JM4C]KAF1299316.1 protein-(glutamine-N5) methyltransferase, release factor-specific [Enterococcus sp. JM4C]
MANKTYREVLLRASSFLEEQGKEGYAIEFLFLERKNWTKTQWLLNMNSPISQEEEQQIQTDVDSLLKDIPPHYLLGYADFYDHRFKVTEATLIPRPETEELVELCLNETKNMGPLSVVDVGTGTGAIALSLKAKRPDWQVTAVDISPEALAVAKENGALLGLDVAFVLGDGLSPINDPIDVLISNPPYISPAEWDLMDESVRTYEPKLALFAENEGLAIYEQLAEEAVSRLKPEGKIFLEIGFQQGNAVRQIFQERFPQKKVEVRQDLSGKDRMIYIHG